MENEKEYLKELDEIIKRGTDWDEMPYEDRLKLVRICKSYKFSLDKYVEFVYTLANVDEEELLKEEKYRTR